MRGVVLYGTVNSIELYGVVGRMFGELRCVLARVLSKQSVSSQ